jgi:hypothetical protein
VPHLTGSEQQIGPAEQHRTPAHGLQQILSVCARFFAVRNEIGLRMADFHSAIRLSEHAFFPQVDTLVAKVFTTSTFYFSTT